MKKERIKTVLLCLLILNCIQLTGRIWLDKKLWPAGYNFFHYAGNVPVIGDLLNKFSDNYTGLEEQTFYEAIRPKRIIAGDGSGRSVLYSNDSEYKDIIKIVSNIIKKLTPDISSDEIHNEQIEKSLLNKSVYLDYGYIADFNTLIKSFEVKDSKDFPTNQYAKSIIIVPENLENKTSICFVSEDGETAVRYRINTGEDKLIKQIDSLKSKRTKRYAFAFDLNLNADADTKNAVRLSPFIVLNTEDKEGLLISVSNCFDNKKTLSEVSDKIVNAFGYNPSSLRKAVSNRGTVRYIENNATVNVYTNGIVEYSATSKGMGIKISNPSDAESVIKAVMSVAEHIYRTVDNDHNANFVLSGDAFINNNGKYKVELDYFINGVPVKFGDNGENAVVSVIENGFIKDFKMHIAEIINSDNNVTWPSVLDAINTYADRNTERSADGILKDVYECYSVIDDKVRAGWFLNSSDGIMQIVHN